jgi:hypothetical protein
MEVIDKDKFHRAKEGSLGTTFLSLEHSWLKRE